MCNNPKCNVCCCLTFLLTIQDAQNEISDTQFKSTARAQVTDGLGVTNTSIADNVNENIEIELEDTKQIGGDDTCNCTKGHNHGWTNTSNTSIMSMKTSKLNWKTRNKLMVTTPAITQRDATMHGVTNTSIASDNVNENIEIQLEDTKQSNCHGVTNTSDPLLLSDNVNKNIEIELEETKQIGNGTQPFETTKA